MGVHTSRRKAGKAAQRLTMVALSSFVACLSAGCMTVRVEAGPNDVKIERHWGYLRLDFATPDQMLVAQASGLGLITSPTGTTLGYSRQRFAALGPRCHVVLWIDASSALDAAARRALEQLSGTCLIDNRSQTTHEVPR